MNKERELLRRALEILEWADEFSGNESLENDIRAYLAAEPEAEPVAWMFQHEDTGLIDYVDTQQVEWGFEKNNPRWQKIGPVYLHPPRPEPEMKHEEPNMKALDEKIKELLGYRYSFVAIAMELGGPVGSDMHNELINYLVKNFRETDDAEELELEEYDAGLLGYFGGGDVEWWQDYIRDLLGRAHDHYQSQVSAHTPKLAESDLCKALEDACAHVDSYGGMSNSYRLVLAKARGENHE